MTVNITSALTVSLYSNNTRIGGVFLGLLEALVSVTTIGSVPLSTFRDVFSFGILVILLVVRPTGLFGRNVEEKL